jgi:hypothetical protein
MEPEQFEKAAQAIIERNRIAREASLQRTSRLTAIMLGNTTDTLEAFTDDLAASFSEALRDAVEAEPSSGADSDGGLTS